MLQVKQILKDIEDNPDPEWVHPGHLDSVPANEWVHPDSNAEPSASSGACSAAANAGTAPEAANAPQPEANVCVHLDSVPADEDSDAWLMMINALIDQWTLEEDSQDAPAYQ